MRCEHFSTRTTIIFYEDLQQETIVKRKRTHKNENVETGWSITK